MKLAIIGSRTFDDPKLLEETFITYFCEWDSNQWIHNVTEIVSGGAKGADRAGAELAKDWDIKLTEFIPDWEKHGKRAGFIRNEDIIKNSDFVLALWCGSSKGTGNSLSIAKRLKKPTLIIYF